jgi:hypothetical protein
MEHRRDHRSMTVEEIQYALETEPGDIDLTEALFALRHLVGVISLDTGQTPRSLLDDEFTKAPSDEFWRATIGATP